MSVSAESPEEEWSPFAEPVPEWDEALPRYGRWWDFHVYFTAVCFLALAAVARGCIVFYVGFAKQKRSQRIYFTILSCLVLILGLSRGLFMTVDAYNSKGTFHPAVAYGLRSASLPCFTASFYLIFVAWLKATRMQHAQAIQRPLTMAIVLGAQFVTSLAFDLAAGFSLKAAYLQLVCQACFVVLSVVLSILFCFLFARIYRATVVNRRRILRASQRAYVVPQNKCPCCTDHESSKSYQLSDTCTQSQNTHVKANKQVTSHGHIALPTGAKVIFASAVLLSLLALQNLIGMLTIYARQAMTQNHPDPWPWWAYEMCLRANEIALIVAILYTVLKPISRHITEKRRHSAPTLAHSSSQLSSA